MSKNIFCKANKKAADYIEEKIITARTIGIIGHIRPDGDAVGACLGLARYIEINFGKKPVVFLESIPEDFKMLAGAEEVVTDFSSQESPAEAAFDLCFMVDCSELKRMGDGAKYFSNANEKICIDHHATNDGEGEGFAVINPERSSASEVVCTLIDMDKLDVKAAECLYLGIVHDTGVFKHSNTSMETMMYAGKLISLGVNTSHIIDDTFYKKTYPQNRALGEALINAELALDGKFIYSIFTKRMMEEYFVSPSDLDGVIDQLRVTDGVKIAVFIYETKEAGTFKISLRANDEPDVAAIAQVFGGGGHVKAAGCEIVGEPSKIADMLIAEAAKQLIKNA